MRTIVEPATISDLFGKDKIEEAKNRAKNYPQYGKYGLTASLFWAMELVAILEQNHWIVKLH